jgi:hypothetical protein
MVTVGNHPKHLHPKLPEQGAASQFPRNSDSIN